MRLIFAAIISLLCSVAHGNQWHHVDATTWLVSPSKPARYIQENQAIIIGKHCAVIVNAHGDFVALERMINTAKRRLQVPVCYLVSNSADIQQVIGISLLQRAFPSAKWYAGQAIADNLVQYKQALNDKVTLLRQSVLLSKQRLSKAKNSQKIQKHIDIAQQRLNDWQHLNLNAPIALPEQERLILELGELEIELKTETAFSSADISVFNPSNQALIAGNSVDSLPLIKHQQLANWLAYLDSLKTNEQINWLLPAHGKPYKKELLQLPIMFIEALNKDLSNDYVKQSLSAHYPKIDRQRLIHYFQLAKRRLDTYPQENEDAAL
ncbi:hypothetical protein PA25_28450 [Pseudoalteromonas sp. A25]|uniref:hypothetical protein n=1 Tax=Pseudoalteromonas sp. A25 TaxID=116092 RepID=UPI001260749B|nr:hypothetical protein [Pseudoalteromonas sp. A25]BBN82860.1 hypothetical protein PA25_28450 [Pseudoalteromonas sp. A25]